MISGVAAVAPSGDGGPVRAVYAHAAQSAAAAPAADEPAASGAVAAPESSAKGSSTSSSDTGGDTGSRAATGQYLASLLAAQITGRAPEARPAKVTPERLASLISYLEASVASTVKPDTDDRAVDVTS